MEEGIEIFHAGTKRDAQDNLLANGGRVLNVTAEAETIHEAVMRAYEAIEIIDWVDGFCRQDIAYRALRREENKS